METEIGRTTFRAAMNRLLEKEGKKVPRKMQRHHKGERGADAGKSKGTCRPLKIQDHLKDSEPLTIHDDSRGRLEVAVAFKKALFKYLVMAWGGDPMKVTVGVWDVQRKTWEWSEDHPAPTAQKRYSLMRSHIREAQSA